MTMPGGRGGLSISGHYLGFARGRARGWGLFLADQRGCSLFSLPAALPPRCGHRRVRDVEAALRLLLWGWQSPRSTCPSGAAASSPGPSATPIPAPLPAPPRGRSRPAPPDPGARTEQGPPSLGAAPPPHGGRGAGCCVPVTPLPSPHLSGRPFPTQPLASGHPCPVPHRHRGHPGPPPFSSLLMGPVLSSAHWHGHFSACQTPVSSFPTATASPVLKTQFPLSPTSGHRAPKRFMFTQARTHTLMGFGVLVWPQGLCLVRAAAADPAPAMCPLLLQIHPLWLSLEPRLLLLTAKPLGKNK